MTHVRMTILTLVAALGCVATVSIDLALRPQGRDVSETQLSAIRGSDPNTFGVGDKYDTCADHNVIAGSYSQVVCNATANADIPANQLCILCDDLTVARVPGVGLDKITKKQNVNCVNKKRWVGTCVAGANGKGDCKNPGLPNGTCFGNFDNYDTQVVVGGGGGP